MGEDGRGRGLKNHYNSLFTIYIPLHGRCFGLLDCLSLASNNMSRPHGKNQPSASFTGFQHLPNLEEIGRAA